MNLNRPGPHARDIERVERASTRAWDKIAARIGDIVWSLNWRRNTASTGTVYLTLTLEHDETGEIEERVYRFGSHAECYNSHDYSVFSGGGANAKQPLPPGYDGYAKQAADDAARWVAEIIE